jgi:hypothetical protein
MHSVGEAEYIAKLLNTLLGDLSAARHAYQVNDILKGHPAIKGVGKDYWAVVNRSFIVHLVITLSKICEAYDRYGKHMPEEQRKQLKVATKEIKGRRVVDLRNRFCAHIHDKEKGRPVTKSELDEYMLALCGGDLAALVPWFWNVDGNPASQSIGGVIERCRDAVIKSYGLDPAVCDI